MTVSSFDRLASLIPPPEGGPFLSDREISAGIDRFEMIDRFPNDYVELVKAYGRGVFDEFINVFLPTTPNPHLDIASQMTSRLEALRQLSGRADPPITLPVSSVNSTTEDVPYKLDRTDPGIIPWAITDNGDAIYWVASQLDLPDEWTVTVNEARGPDWQEFPMGCCEFLYGVLSGSVQVRHFPDDFPSSSPTFAPTD